MRVPPVFRSLARARGLSAIVMGTVALGVGALTTTFGVVDAALLRQPPFTEARRLAILYITRASAGEAPYRERWSYARIQLLRKLATSFESVANFSRATLTLTGTGDPETIDGEVVGPAYFPTLRIGAVKGRTFVSADDDAPGAHPVVLLGYALWQRRFSGDSGIVGHSVGVNGVPLTVIGVLPRGFAGLSGRAQLWIPTTMAPSLTYDEYLATNQNFISAAGRLKPGVDLAGAQAELKVLGARIDQALPSGGAAGPDASASATAALLNDARVDDATRRSMAALLAAVALLYLLACANVTSLFLGRVAGRRREAAVRAALGSGRARLLGTVAAETAVLVTTGGFAGIALAAWTSTAVSLPVNAWGARNFYGSLATFAEPAFGARSLAFGLGVIVVTILLVAWAPVAATLRLDIVAGLRGTRGTGGGTGTLARPSATGAIVALEAALAVMLLVAGGLMIDSFARIRRVKIGVEPEHVLTFMLRPSEVRIPPAAAPAFIGRVLEEISHVPGVVAATVDGGAPVSGSAGSVLYVIGRPAPPPDQAPPVFRHYVAPDHFKTLGVPLVRGRTFTTADATGSPRVAIISESAARHFWPNEDPIGQRVWFGGGSNFDRPDSSAAIVGIVGDVMDEPLDRHPNEFDFYTPYTQFTYATRMVMVLTAGDPAASVSALRRAVRAVDPDLPLFDVQPLVARIGSSWSGHRFDAVLFGAFGALALLLATSGIFAVVANAVAERTREMGIRLALGAQPGAVIRLVVRDGMAFPLAGVVAGIAGALALTRVLRSSLYEVTPTAPRVFAATVTLLVAASVLACLVPARRATRVDPMEALRAE